ncbi:uncharacterized protein BKA78DRAFT_357833 [Phyllosticta capitalensis]|uniref:Uncharacterized protein n=1 Tax=Phyllosticta capitalensis TaxID=121624 RepID=A0ABR1Y9V1_9PEZI
MRIPFTISRRSTVVPIAPGNLRGSTLGRNMSGSNTWEEGGDIREENEVGVVAMAVSLPNLRNLQDLVVSSPTANYAIRAPLSVRSASATRTRVPLRRASTILCLRERPTVSPITPINRGSIFFANTTYGTNAHGNNTFRNDAYGSNTCGTNANAINTPIANEQQSPISHGCGTQQNCCIQAGWHGTKE